MVQSDQWNWPPSGRKNKGCSRFIGDHTVDQPAPQGVQKRQNLGFARPDADVGHICTGTEVRRISDRFQIVQDPQQFDGTGIDRQEYGIMTAPTRSAIRMTRL